MFGVLDAVGVQNGPSHSEVMWVGGDYKQSQGEPCLVETGARLHGAQGPRLWADCYGRENSQQFLTVDVLCGNGFAHEAKYQKQQNNECPFDFGNKQCVQMYLISEHAGELEEDVQTSCPGLLQLPTLHAALLDSAKVGCFVVPTKDLLTTPGCLLLIGSQEEIDRDHAQLREWERSGTVMTLKKAQQRLLSGSSLSTVDEGDMDGLVRGSPIGQDGFATTQTTVCGRA